jgi:hypothetical protein
MTGCIAFVMGWIISKVMNTSKSYDAGTLAVFHSRHGTRLVRLVQTTYIEQPFVYVETVHTSDDEAVSKPLYPYCVKAEKLMMFTVEGDAVNEANWNK